MCLFEFKEIKWNTKKMYVTPKDACKHYGASYPSLRRWAEQGKLKYKRTPGGDFRYWIDDDLLQTKNQTQLQTSSQDQPSKQVVVYARVVSSKQKDELSKQLDCMLAKYPAAFTERDVGSSLDFNRKGIQRVMDLICAEQVDKVVVTHKDRISRFVGYDIFEWLCKKHNVQIVVEPQVDDDKQARKEEIVDDLVAITQRFSHMSKKQS